MQAAVRTLEETSGSSTDTQNDSNEYSTEVKGFSFTQSVMQVTATSSEL